MDDAHWEVLASKGEYVEYRGRPALRLRGGLALLKGIELGSGVIDMDIAAESGIAFAGPVFHLADDGNYEKVYLRTFLSGSREATQYTPVFNHMAAWQLYHGPDYNQKVVFDRRAWIPVRIVIDGDRADVYVEDLDTPLLHIDPLRRGGKAGRVGVINERIPEAMGPADIYVSNVRVRTEPAPLQGSVREPNDERPGRIPAWQVSNLLSAASIESRETTPSPDEYRWTEVQSEPGGLVNLAQVHHAGRDADTVFVRATVRSDTERLGRLKLGFSERVRVFWNGRLVFSADDTWHSRDITFQGVIGWFDELAVPLAAGDNELWIAVTENVDMNGGWGVQAAFADPTGLSFGLGDATP